MMAKLELLTAFAIGRASFHGCEDPHWFTIRIKLVFGSILRELFCGCFPKVMLSLTLVVDTHGVIIVAYSRNTWSGIQDDLERMEVSIVPIVYVISRRVGILVQKISRPEIVQSDLGVWFEIDCSSLCSISHTSFPSSQLMPVDAYVWVGMKWDGRMEIAIESRLRIGGERALTTHQG